VIRNVVMAKLKDGFDKAAMDQVIDDLRSLDLPGMLQYTLGYDAGLRDGNWDFVIVCDLADIDSYRTYDTDATHNEIRGRLGQQVEQMARAQFEITES
jgi:hypothetical protein